MKRMLCITHSMDTGGAETFLMKIYRTLPKEQYQIDFIISVPCGCYTQEILNCGGKIYTIPQRKKSPIQAMCGICRIVKNNHYDSVFKFGDTSIAVFDLIAAKLGGAKILAVRSCNALTGLSFTKRGLVGALRPLLNAVANVKLAPSMLAAEFTFGKRCAHRSVHLLNNGVDLNVFHYNEEGRCSIREELHLQNRLVVGHIGRFHKQKNHLYLLEVFRKIHEIRQDAVLLLIGTGDLEHSVRSRVRELDLEAAVLFLGQRFDIPSLLSAMDVFVFPSLHEGMPNTVIEAQAAGLPCVISNTITPEADITGLVTYLSLNTAADQWAETALAAANQSRKDTTQVLRDKGYDINDTAEKLMRLMFQ